MKVCAISTIRLTLAPKIKYHVLDQKDPKTLRKKLEGILYVSKSLANKLFLKKYLFELHMEEEVFLNYHRLNKLNQLIRSC